MNKEELKNYNKSKKSINIFLEDLKTNNKLTAETLNEFSKQNDLLIKKAVASNENTSEETLDYLSNSDDFEVLEVVADNINTSPKTLQKLFENLHGVDSYDEYYQETIDVLVSISNNINISETVLEEIKEFSEEWIIEDTVKHVLNNVKKIKESDIDNIKDLIEFINKNTEDKSYRINVLYMLSDIEEYSELIFDNVILERFVSEHDKTRELFENSDFYIKDIDDDQYYSIIERSDFIDLFFHQIINKNNYELKRFLELFFDEEYVELLED